jgi:N-acetylmuramoyl-L-alanine amidase
MIIIEKFLSINPYSRPGRKLDECKGIILHYTGKNNQRAEVVWNYFAFDCPGNKHYSSAQYIVDLDGSIIQTMPDDEVAYHCGTSKIDPVSGRVYTLWARKKFGRYCEDFRNNSPNNCTIGIELCVNARGDFTKETITAAVKLVAKLVNDNKLTVDDVGHHHKVVGWKDCPLPWVKSSDKFDDFKKLVNAKLVLSK